MVGGGGLIVLCLALPLASCETALFDPFENEARYFTLFGYLDPLAHEHVLRVVPLSRLHEPIVSAGDLHASLDAYVRTINLTTGERYTWDYRLERLADETYGHIFRANFPVFEGHTYRLEVRRADSLATSAEVQVPRPGIMPDPHFYAVSKTSQSITQDVELPEVTTVWDVEVIYHIPRGPRRETLVPIHYGRPGERLGDDRWRFTLRLSEDVPKVRAILNPDAPEVPAQLKKMSLRLKVLDHGWHPPGGVFDPEIVAQPGMLSNVENGYGYFGAFAIYSYEWCVDPDVLQEIGYRPYECDVRDGQTTPLTPAAIMKRTLP